MNYFLFFNKLQLTQKINQLNRQLAGTRNLQVLLGGQCQYKRAPAISILQEVEKIKEHLSEYCITANIIANNIGQHITHQQLFYALKNFHHDIIKVCNELMQFCDELYNLFVLNCKDNQNSQNLADPKEQALIIKLLCKTHLSRFKNVKSKLEEIRDFEKEEVENILRCEEKIKAVLPYPRQRISQIACI